MKEGSKGSNLKKVSYFPFFDTIESYDNMLISRCAMVLVLCIVLFAVSPCNEIPLSYDETFGYLPILAGLFEDDLGGAEDAINWVLVINISSSNILR